MNQASLEYWNNYWSGQEMPERVTAWQFGGSPDYLAQLVIDGVKKATCSGYVFYEVEKEPLPTTEDYSVVLNSKDEPVAIIKTVDVQIMPMNEVPEEFAISEGEGDRTYQYWWNVHVEFFTKELREIGREYSEDMLLVCERFELVDVKK
ncbi:ASCH domain-containing protein [Sutcliffiella horikoshii]|uniref:ASCH domain-containing protein n=1 Tax=Sutcliffiella horikoshii TaxID=79883 RepID=UPI00384D5FCC